MIIKFETWGIVILLVVAVFAFSYNGSNLVSAVEEDLVFENEEVIYDDLIGRGGENKMESLGSVLDVLWGQAESIQGIVSIFNEDLRKSVCTVNNDGSVCQIYSRSECEENCDGSCVEVTDGSSENMPEECTMGLCYDEDFGTCEPNSPKERCESTGGISLPPDSNDARCRKGCCFLGDQGRFITNQQCRLQAESWGLEFGGDSSYFDETIIDELECFVQANANMDAKGACTMLRGDGLNDCAIVNLNECFGIGGTFNEGLLCSHPSLNTTCTKMNKTACDDELNGIYWYDSCGNRENLFDGRKSDDGWNDGEILARSESCSVLNSGDTVANQDDCGNCNYLEGSKCGEEISGQELDDEPDGEIVCKDMGCEYEGQRRENGESWCAYQSQFGVQGLDIPGLSLVSGIWEGGNLGNLLGGQRSLDTPGSRHFNMVCIDGEVTSVACQDYRNQICVESQVEKDGGGTFSHAFCRTNRWQECINYNPNPEDLQGMGVVGAIAAMSQCEDDQDCFVKYVNVDEDFQFPFCAPKYPPGFDLEENADGAETVCGYATQKCTTVYVKKMDLKYECEINCECETWKFAKEMNDLCVSLGDCGGSVNYIGDHGSGGYVVKEGDWNPSFSIQDLIGGLISGFSLTDVSEAVPGKYIDGKAYPKDETEDNVESEGSFGGMIERMFGNQFRGSGSYGGGPRVKQPKSSNLEGGGEESRWSMGLSRGIGGDLYDFGGAASIGFISGGLNLQLMKIVGVGDIKKVERTFECQPWQPSHGGERCEECGNGEGLHDDLQCSRYNCESLGQSCKFIDQEPNSICIDASPDDTSGPRISEWEEIAFEGTEYENVNSNGYEVRMSDGKECITQFESVRFGVMTDEYARCRYGNVPLLEFENMIDLGGGTMSKNHSTVIGERDLVELFEEGYESEENNYIDLYVKCQDVNGNPSPGEYAVNLCVYPEDLTAPAIFISSLDTLPFGTEETTVSVITNEPSELRWSFDDIPFGDMTGTFDCSLEGTEDASLAQLAEIFDCRDYGALIPIDEDEVRICVKGRDHPEWEGTDEEGDRNTNEQCRWITLTRTEFDLEIVSIEPNETTIMTGLAISTINLVVETTGGDGGVVSCLFYVNGNGPGIFVAQEGNVHSQEFNRMTPGDYDIDVECSDITGNSAEGSSSFIVELDSNSPEVTRIYNQGGKLYVITNEKADCAFVTSEDEVQSKCGFEFDDGELIPAVQEGGMTHSVSFEDELAHYIRCRDVYGNEPSGCNAVVRGGIA